MHLNDRDDMHIILEFKGTCKRGTQQQKPFARLNTRIKRSVDKKKKEAAHKRTPFTIIETATTTGAISTAEYFANKMNEVSKCNVAECDASSSINCTK